MLKEKILVVDDEINIQELIKFNLMSQGYDVVSCGDGKEAFGIVKDFSPDLILLDVMLPGMDGYKVCKEIRKDSSITTLPIIMITAKGEESDKIHGLEIGADDYITKPFSVKELIARVKAVLRRTKIQHFDDNYSFGEITIDFQKHEVKKNNEKIELTFKEFELLSEFIKNKGRVLTREYLLEKIWGYEYIGETRTIDVHIRHLRKKIETDDKKPKFIETIRGIGYRFNVGE
ncbi:response regulator [Clostridium sp. DL1XJH146]